MTETIRQHNLRIARINNRNTQLYYQRDKNPLTVPWPVVIILGNTSPEGTMEWAEAGS